jgi:hypothetical protein
VGEHAITVDFGRPLADQPHVGHNRWHPAIAPAASIESGDSLVVQALDAMDGQLTMSSTAADVAAASLRRVHPMTGPVRLAGAEPGDLLAVRIDDIEPAGFGWTAQIPLRSRTEAACSGHRPRPAGATPGRAGGQPRRGGRHRRALGRGRSQPTVPRGA